MASLDRQTYHRIYGPTTGDRIALSDLGLTLEVEQDDTPYGDEVLGGCGKTWRDGFYGRRRDSELDLLISNVVLVDPLLGVRKTCIGVKEGRIVGIGRAGSPDVFDGVDLIVGPHTALVPGEGLIATPGAIDSHVHLAAPTLLEVGLSAGVTTIVGMGIGGVWDVGANPKRNLHVLTESLRDTAVNVLLLARGSTRDAAAMESALASGAGGFKVHEDYSASPACVDACLSVAVQADVGVALHTDTLNEFGMLADTVAATAGRTVHAYHVEGGGGHPDLLEILEQPHVLGSSTTPTIPYARHTVAELFPMTMTVHRQHADFTSDLETTRSRVHEAGIQAENFLHHLGAISIVNSDSLGMGRMGETVLQFLAKITINAALAHGIAGDVGSIAPGRLADIVLWKPAWFGAKPEFVIKSGFVAWGATGQGNGSTRLSQPRLMGPFFGSMGGAPRRLAATFVAESALGGPDLVGGPMYLPVHGAQGLTRADMVRNSAVPSVQVPMDGSPVQVNGRSITLAPLDRVPVGQAAFLA